MQRDHSCAQNHVLDGCDDRSLQNTGVGKVVYVWASCCDGKIDISRAFGLFQEPAKPPLPIDKGGGRCMRRVGCIDSASPLSNGRHKAGETIVPRFGAGTNFGNIIEPPIGPDLGRRHRDLKRQSFGQAFDPGDHLLGLPQAPLRNGNLNQLSYSLYFFIRDIAENDLVTWMDRQFTTAAECQPIIAPDELGMALIEPMRQIHGISDKILNMVLSELLLGAGRGKPFWIEAGAALIAIDTLVHNFLARTGILSRANADHPYGPQCYASGGCADIINVISSNIDSRQFNSRFPSNFPRFVQKSIWHYCAMEGLNVCNGNKIKDSFRCSNTECRIFGSCDRISRY